MINYSKSGKGNTIVLLHGFCENNTCFNDQVFFLQKDFCVITPDLPGFGKSEPLNHTSIELMADEVYKILVHEKIQSCVMIGHSMGGYVSLAFAEKYFALLKGIGLMHSTALADNEERKTKRDQAIRVIEEKGFELYVKNFIPPLFSASFTQKKIIDEFVESGFNTSVKGLTQALLSMKNRESKMDFLKKTDLPVLFFVGKEDSIIPESDMFFQASLCKQSEIVYLQKSAHMGYVEEAKKTNEAIKKFVHQTVG